MGDDLGIARVGSRGAEHDRCPRRRAEDLVDQGQLQLPEALAAELRTEVGGPETVVADLLLQRLNNRSSLLVEGEEGPARVDQVERFDVLGLEVPDPLELLFELGLSLEIPCHCLNSFASRPPQQSLMPPRRARRAEPGAISAMAARCA